MANEQVLVGRNNIQNDELSHRVAKEGDIWMHVRGFPGAHTLLQVPSGREASEEDVQCAADLAAFFSKARGEGRAPVILASPADLKRPKGSRPGQVDFQLLPAHHSFAKPMVAALLLIQHLWPGPCISSILVS